MKKFKFFITVMAAAVIGFAAFANNSVIENDSTSAKLTTELEASWHYTGLDNSTGSLQNPLNWTQTAPHPQCGQGTSLPCTLEGPADEDDFINYVSTLTFNEIMSLSPVKRP